MQQPFYQQQYDQKSQPPVRISKSPIVLRQSINNSPNQNDPYKQMISPVRSNPSTVPIIVPASVLKSPIQVPLDFIP